VHLVHLMAVLLMVSVEYAVGPTAADFAVVPTARAGRLPLLRSRFQIRHKAL
jgi:hypothetical protein